MWKRRKLFKSIEYDFREKNVKTKELSNYTGKCITTAATSAAATTITTITTTTTTTNTTITGNNDNNLRNDNLMTHTMRNHIF